MGRNWMLHSVLIMALCLASALTAWLWVGFAGRADAKDERGSVETASGSAEPTEPEIKPEDIVVRVYEESPGKLREKTWNINGEGLPEEWVVSAWQDSGQKFNLTFFGNSHSDVFEGTVYSQWKGPSFSKPDMFMLFDTDQDGVVDQRSLSFQFSKGSVYYCDLNMDGFLDLMNVSEENESTTYILLNDTWTFVSEMSLKSRQCRLMVDGSERTAAFIDGKWTLEGSATR